MPFQKNQPDNIFGLGNKTKKAEKKLKKVDKKIASGNLGAAERKLKRATKKVSKTANPLQSPLRGRIAEYGKRLAVANQDRETLVNEQQAQNTPSVSSSPTVAQGEVLPLDTLQPSNTLPTVPMGSGGGGGGTYESEPQAQAGRNINDVIEGDQSETGEESPAGVFNIKTVLIVAAIVAAIFFIPKIISKNSKS